jgi:hypothetical protein
MAFSALSKALIGGMLNTWGANQQGMDKLHIGANTIEAYITAGVLYLSSGMMGLYDGSQDWNITNSAAAAVSVAGLAASCWASVEISVVAGVPVITLTSIGGATNPASIPASFTGAYDGTKGGYYITGTKRCHSIVWINAAGAAAGVINQIGGCDGYVGYGTSDNSSLTIYQFEKLGFQFDYDYTLRFITTGISYVVSNTLIDQTIYIIGGRTVTLPDATKNKGRKIRILKSDDNAWWVKMIATAGTLNSKSGTAMTSAYIRRYMDSVTWISDGNNWIAIEDDRLIYIDSGAIRRSVWNVYKKMGSVNLVHTGAALVDATVRGMKLAGATSASYGWITAYDSGTKTIYLRDVSTGNTATVFSSGETLNITDVDGNVIGSTTLSAANWKNTDSDFYHGIGVTYDKLLVKFLYSPDASIWKEATIVDNGRSNVCICYMDTDTNILQVRGGNDGLVVPDANNQMSLITTTDAYYKMIVWKR